MIYLYDMCSDGKYILWFLFIYLDIKNKSN